MAHQFRINLWEKFAGSKGLHFNNNLLLKYQSFYLSNWMTFEMNDSRTKLDDKLLLGYQHKEHSAALTLSAY